MRVSLSLVALAASSASAFLLPARLAPQQQRLPKLSMASTVETGNKDIVDTAVAAGSFSTLAAALTKAGLVDVLKGTGPFTVFAPTDEAFAKIPKATLDAILADKEQLTSILTYHVVPGKVTAVDVLKLSSAKTVQGSEVSISVQGAGSVKVDNANVVATDVLASNGVIHVIDSVILPSAKPAAASSTKAAAKADPLPSLEVEKAGATAPFGYFDPLGLSKGKDLKTIKKWRESELKHGRIAMLATVGVLVQEAFSPFYNPEVGSTDPGAAYLHFQKLEAVNPFLFLFLIFGIGVTESFTISKGWDSPDETRALGNRIAGMRDNYIAGDLEFDPLNLAPRKDIEKFLSYRSKELNNGRLAMLAWVGMMAQELLTDKKLFG